MPFGVDEAGKGPALGSMFAAAVYLEDPDSLPDGIADSKDLSPTRREELAATLREDDRFAVGVAEISTDRIDDPATDMNSLTVEAHATAIEGALEAADGSLEGISGLCDACDTDADRFARRVADSISATGELDLEARHGADEESSIVGAASIVAKVERDAHVETIAAEYGDVGSGYPSDPTTQEFLESYVEANGELPPFARSSWSTCEELLASVQQTGLGEF